MFRRNKIKSSSSNNDSKRTPRSAKRAARQQQRMSGNRITKSVLKTTTTATKTSSSNTSVSSLHSGSTVSTAQSAASSRNSSSRSDHQQHQQRSVHWYPFFVATTHPPLSDYYANASQEDLWWPQAHMDRNMRACRRGEHKDEQEDDEKETQQEEHAVDSRGREHYFRNVLVAEEDEEEEAVVLRPCWLRRKKNHYRSVKWYPGFIVGEIPREYNFFHGLDVDELWVSDDRLQQKTIRVNVKGKNKFTKVLEIAQDKPWYLAKQPVFTGGAEKPDNIHFYPGDIIGEIPRNDELFEGVQAVELWWSPDELQSFENREMTEGRKIRFRKTTTKETKKQRSPFDDDCSNKEDKGSPVPPKRQISGGLDGNMAIRRNTDLCVIPEELSDKDNEGDTESETESVFDIGDDPEITAVETSHAVWPEEIDDDDDDDQQDARSNESFGLRNVDGLDDLSTGISSSHSSELGSLYLEDDVALDNATKVSEKTKEDELPALSPVTDTKSESRSLEVVTPSVPASIVQVGPPGGRSPPYKDEASRNERQRFTFNESEKESQQQQQPQPSLDGNRRPVESQRIVHSIDEYQQHESSSGNHRARDRLDSSPPMHYGDRARVDNHLREGRPHPMGQTRQFSSSSSVGGPRRVNEMESRSPVVPSSSASVGGCAPRRNIDLDNRSYAGPSSSARVGGYSTHRYDDMDSRSVAGPSSSASVGGYGARRHGDFDNRSYAGPSSAASVGGYGARRSNDFDNRSLAGPSSSSSVGGYGSRRGDFDNRSLTGHHSPAGYGARRYGDQDHLSVVSHMGNRPPIHHVDDGYSNRRSYGDDESVRSSYSRAPSVSRHHGAYVQGYDGARPMIARPRHYCPDPLDPRYWYQRPSNMAPTLKGSPYGHGYRPRGLRVGFVRGDVISVAPCRIHDFAGICDDALWWSKMELQARRVSDGQETVINQDARMFVSECQALYGRVVANVAHYYRDPHQPPSSQYGFLAYSPDQLKALLSRDLMFGLSCGYRGLELGGLDGRRERTRMAARAARDFTANYQRLRMRVNFNEGLSLAVEEISAVDRIWSQLIALAEELQEEPYYGPKR